MSPPFSAPKRTRKCKHTTHLDRHARAVEPVREEHALAQHTVKPRGEFDLQERQRVSGVEGAVRVREGESVKPLGKLHLHLDRGKFRELERKG